MRIGKVYLTAVVGICLGVVRELLGVGCRRTSEVVGCRVVGGDTRVRGGRVGAVASEILPSHLVPVFCTRGLPTPALRMKRAYRGVSVEMAGYPYGLPVGERPRAKLLPKHAGSPARNPYRSARVFGTVIPTVLLDITRTGGAGGNSVFAFPWSPGRFRERVGTRTPTLPRYAPTHAFPLKWWHIQERSPWLGDLWIAISVGRLYRRAL